MSCSLKIGRGRIASRLASIGRGRILPGVGFEMFCLSGSGSCSTAEKIFFDIVELLLL